MRNRWAIPAALPAARRPPCSRRDGRFEKTIAFPRGTDAKLDFTYEKVTIREVQCRNYPDAEDIEKARDQGPRRPLLALVGVPRRQPREPRVPRSTSGSRSWTRRATVIKASDRSGTIDAGKIDDSFRVSTRLRTIDIADSPKVRIKAEIVPK